MKTAKEEFSAWLWLFFVWQLIRIGQSAVQLLDTIHTPIALALNLIDLFLLLGTFILLIRRKKTFIVFFVTQVLYNSLLQVLLVSQLSISKADNMSFLIMVLSCGAWFFYFINSKHVNRIISPKSNVEAQPEIESAQIALPGNFVYSESQFSTDFPADQSESPVLHSEDRQKELSSSIPTPEPPQPPTANNRKYYCKLCGSPLSTDKKCTRCGKQYFHVNRAWLLKVYAICITLSLIAVSCLNMYNCKIGNLNYDLLMESRSQVAEIEKEQNILKDKIKVLQGQKELYQEQSEELAILRPILSFYENNAVFVTETGTKYHKASCYHISGKNFYIYNVEAAKWRGYTACADCW